MRKRFTEILKGQEEIRKGQVRQADIDQSNSFHNLIESIGILDITISRFSKESSFYSKKIVFLSWVLIILTAVIIIATVLTLLR